MNLPELVERYKGGEPLYDLAAKLRVRKETLRAALQGEGVTIRGKGRPQAVEHEKLGTPPKPKPCVHGCGRMAQSWSATACVPCAIAPPCTCKKPKPTVSKYNGEYRCQGCGRLIAEPRARGER